MNDVYLSKKGFKNLKRDISKLEQELSKIRQQLQDSDSRDNRENRFERIEKLYELETTESELSEKKQLLASAKLLSSKRSRMNVALGSVVDLIDQSGRIMRYTLVESIEADPSDGKISVDSPLGKTLIGRNLKDTVELSTKRTTNQLKLVGIS